MRVLRPTPPWCTVAFLAGAALAVITSAGIVEERLSAGSVGVGLFVNGFVLLASILSLGVVRRRASGAANVLLAQTLGAIVGIAIVHLALRGGWIPRPSWLAERPAQLVNDGVAVLATLALVWACAHKLDLRLLVFALATVTLYKATGRFWHLDVPPGGFAVRVQDLVVAQVGATALALAIYRQLTIHAA